MNELNNLYGTLASKMTSNEESAGPKNGGSSSSEGENKSKTKKGEVEDADFEVVE